jgi:hypothetical protein
MRSITFRCFIITFIFLLDLAPHLSLCSTADRKHNLSQSSDPIIIIQPLPVSGLSSGDYDWACDEDSITIPLLRAGRLFLIEATVDNEKGYLVFDTGASEIVLNKTYFRDYDAIANHSSGGITGSLTNVDKIAVEKLEICGLKFKDVIADVINLGHIENRRGVKILGLIGFGMIKDFEVVFNPSLGQLQLYKIDKKGERVNTSSEKFVPDFKSSFDFKNNILFLKTAFNGKNLRFCFDTGAETNVIDRYAPKNVLNCITITRRSTLSGAGSSTSEVLFGTMNGFPFGPNILNEMETIITNLDPLSEAYGTKIDGMLGYSFLSKGVICINFVKKEFAISYLKAAEE